MLEKYGLPDPDTLELGADVTGFMRKEIPELLRRKALRALWKTNPVLAVLDGLNDYDEDYTDAAFAAKSVNTLYKVGQGMFDKKPVVMNRTRFRSRSKSRRRMLSPPNRNRQPLPTPGVNRSVKRRSKSRSAINLSSLPLPKPGWNRSRAIARECALTPRTRQHCCTGHRLRL